MKKLLVVLSGAMLCVAPMSFSQSAKAPVAAMKAVAVNTILSPANAAKLAPATIFFRGQSASTQLRNTEGIKFSDATILLAGLVDSSGYSSGIQQKYQGFILSEVPMVIEGKTLPAGAYGFGFVGAHTFIVMDLGANTLVQVSWVKDAAMRRPRPFQILRGAMPGSYRLYSGRNYVDFQRGK